MSDAPDAIRNRGYHAHIYYDPERTRPTASCSAMLSASSSRSSSAGSATSRSARIRSPTSRLSSHLSSSSSLSSG